MPRHRPSRQATIPAPVSPATAAPNGATTQTTSAASAAPIAIPSWRSKGTGNRVAPVAASQLRVKFGTIRPPTIIISSA